MKKYMVFVWVRCESDGKLYWYCQYSGSSFFKAICKAWLFRKLGPLRIEVSK